ncbi:helix-turn-helix domain-containing protein [Caenibacillus caldisaponilyticus]|jgi:transcriptional regulator with XRE-family HTH domain|uniref:helix-turn-helix domain-containing protein n=1 Tax=Caenibacillus caldisaponilyticus TaxID=1674942 RepID=UPI00098831CD|nr:helix-turn-helix transcriptional regulator [Caenibacillus caldisaponilyticus]
MEAELWGRRIRAFRKLKGFTQAELAKSIDVSLSVLGEIERGNRMPTEAIIQRISETLGVSVDEMLEFNKES